MAVVNSTLDRIGDVTAKISAVLPVIRSTAESVTTAINGHANPAPVQQPAQVNALVPRNAGGLDLNVAKWGISGSLVLGLLAVAAVFYFVKRR